MFPSPLTLERHFFSKVEIDSHIDGHLGIPNLFHCDAQLGRAEGAGRRFQIILKLKLDSPPEKKATYTGEIHAVGLFRVADNWPEENVNDLVQVNGCSILFGAIRELILNLTSRGPWPPVMLNSFSFVRPKDKPQDVVPSELTPKKAAP